MLGHPNGRTRLGGVSGLLLVRSFSASDRCNGIPAAEVCCHNTHGKKPDYHSHADIFPFSCGQDAYSQGESLVVDVAGSVDRIERLADGHCHHNWLYAGVGGDIPGAIAVLFQSGFLFLPRITSAGTPLVGKGISTVRRLTALRGLPVFSGLFGLISWT